MRRIPIMVIGVFLVFASLDAYASCSICLQQSCTRNNGTEVEATKCESDTAGVPAGTKGVKSCRTVANCGGCVGFVCIIRDPYPTSAGEKTWRVGDATIERLEPDSTNTCLTSARA